MQSSKINTKTSIFNPEMEISDDKWGVSFVKHSSLISKKEGGMQEHGFLIIQAPDMLYRKEILYNPMKPGYAKVKTGQRSVRGDEDLELQMNSLIWDDEDTSFTVANLGHNTWLVSKSQALELASDIESDKTKEIKFSIHGVASILKDGEYQERVSQMKWAFSGMLLVHTPALLATIGMTATAPISPLLPILFVTSNVCSATFAAGARDDNYFDPTPYKERFKAHNCATWCVEKLTNLNIPMINKDLGFHFTDKFAYVTGLHIPADSLDKNFAQGILLGGMAKQCGLSVEEIIAKSEERKELAKQAKENPEVKVEETGQGQGR